MDEYEAKVCFKLYRQGCFGAGHRLIDTVVSGFPSHELDQVKDAIDRLVADNFLIAHPTRHGRAIHINGERRQEVYDALRKRPEHRWLPR